MRHASYKNLFSKNSTMSVGSAGSSMIAEESSLVVPILQQKSLLDAKKGLTGQPIMSAAGGLGVSRSQVNFQNLISEDDLLHQQLTTDDEEVFDQDGGQDGGASNFVDMEESESQILHHGSFSPSGLMNVQQRLTQPPPILSSFGAGWGIQDPHIDEERSDAEEDDSYENNFEGTMRSEQLCETCVEYDDEDANEQRQEVENSYLD